MQPLALILEKLKQRLKTSRYEHTLRVMAYGETLAIKHGVSKEKFKYAAALHDYCKHTSDEEILNNLLPHQLNEVLKNQPNLGHGYMAALVAKEEYGVTDEDILGAIADHTFGSENISDLGKVLYLADHLEPKRNYEGVKYLRELAEKDLDKAVILAASHTLMYELEQGHMLHEETLKMRNLLLRNS